MVQHGVMEIVNGILQLRSAKIKVKFEIWELLEGKELDFLSFFQATTTTKTTTTTTTTTTTKVTTKATTKATTMATTTARTNLKGINH